MMAPRTYEGTFPGTDNWILLHNVPRGESGGKYWYTWVATLMWDGEERVVAGNSTQRRPGSRIWTRSITPETRAQEAPRHALWVEYIKPTEGDRHGDARVVVYDLRTDRYHKIRVWRV